MVLPVSHTFMMNSPLVVAQTLRFLQDGAFQDDLTLLDVVGEIGEAVGNVVNEAGSSVIDAVIE